MKAELRFIETPKGETLDTIRPDGGLICTTIYALIGPEGKQGEEIFQFEVCSPKWLEQELKSCPTMWDSRRLIIAQYDPEAIKTHVRKRQSNIGA